MLQVAAACEVLHTCWTSVGETTVCETDSPVLLTSGMLPLMMTGTLNVSVMVVVLAVAVMVTGGNLHVLALAQLVPRAMDFGSGKTRP